MFDRSQNFESCRLIILKSLTNNNQAFDCTYWRSVIDFVEIFNDPDVCINHVKGISGENIFLIVDNELCNEIISRIPELRVIHTIYIFNTKSDRSEIATAEEPIKKQPTTKGLPLTTNKAHQSSKIAGIYTDLNELVNDLSNHLRVSTRNSNILSQIIEECLPIPEWTFELLNRTGRRAFPFLIQILLQKEPNDNGKQVFSDKCRHYYADNPSTLNIIDEFDQTYKSDMAVWWYTRNTFLYLLLNKSLRQQNIEMIINLHFFLYDLHNQLSVTYEGTNPRTTIEKYYRGQIMTLEEVQALQQSNVPHKAITLNSFLSTTKDYQLALIFAGSGSYDKDDELQSVIFIIELLPSNSNSMDKEYADITQLSACPSEQETLFTVASLLYLDGYEYSENEKTWFIKLTNWSVSECFSYGRYSDQIQKSESQSLDAEFIHIGRLLSEKNVDYNLFDIFDEERKNDPPVTEESLNIIKKIYYDILLENGIINQFVYNVGVGSLAFTSGQIDTAAEYLLKALPNENEIYSSNQDGVTLLLYDTLGNIYREKCEYDLALRYYSTSVDISSTKESLSDLACIYKILGHYDHALALSSFYIPIARACDKRKDAVSNLREWKLFVDYTSMDKRYLSKYYLEIIKEYLEIGKVNAGIPSEISSHNYDAYRLKMNEIPVSANDILINRRCLQIAIDCFQRVIDLSHQFHSKNISSRIVSSANTFLEQTYIKISEYNIFNDSKNLFRAVE